MKTQNTNQIRPFTVTTTSQMLFGNNAFRKAFLVQNIGTNIVEVCSNSQLYGQGVSIPVGAILSDDHFNCQGELWIVSTVGNSDVRVWEVISLPSYDGGK